LSAAAPTALTFTGERFAPEVTGAIRHEHWHRHCLVEPLAGRLRWRSARLKTSLRAAA
jgi:hypothetical protein